MKTMNETFRAMASHFFIGNVEVNGDGLSIDDAITVQRAFFEARLRDDRETQRAMEILARRLALPHPRDGGPRGGA